MMGTPQSHQKWNMATTMTFIRSESQLHFSRLWSVIHSFLVVIDEFLIALGDAFGYHDAVSGRFFLTAVLVHGVVWAAAYRRLVAFGGTTGAVWASTDWYADAVEPLALPILVSPCSVFRSASIRRLENRLARVIASSAIASTQPDFRRFFGVDLDVFLKAIIIFIVPLK